MPPPAEGVASRIFLGPALRAQSDRRLVTLVRDGYEAAFEEIVRRYAAPLGRYATAIVGGRAEDVTQDAFSKALLALRRDGAEVELRPWLYRIVRNTALNDLRDRPPTAQEPAESIAGGRSAAEEAERREELAELMGRLRALPEPQRAAIVMRELEGLSHAEIAAALGVTGGAARQAIHRARTALRDAVGAAIPLPLVRALIDHGAEAAVAVGGGGAAGAAAAGASIGGVGGGGALKAGLATALIAGSVGAGVALDDERGKVEASARPAAATGNAAPAGPAEGGSSSSFTAGSSGGEDRSDGRGSEDRGHSGRGQGDDSGSGEDSGSDSSGPSRNAGPRSSGHDGRRSGSHSGPGAGSLADDDDGGGGDAEELDGDSEPGDDGGDDSSGSGSSDGSGSDSGPGSGETQLSGEGSSSSGSGSSGSSLGSGSSSGSGSGDEVDDE